MLNKIKENEISKKRLSKGNIPIPKDLVFTVFIPRPHQASIYLFKVTNGNTKTYREICSKLTIKPPEYVIDVILVSILLMLNRFQALLWCF